MSALWTSDEIAKAVDGAVLAEFRVDGVAFDSREVGPNDLFIALKGETTDGHRFLDGAFGNGAAGSIVSEDCAHPHVRVANTMEALNALGTASRARTGAQIIGVTGSVGKTGVKEALFAALDRPAEGQTHRSVKSYNNHTGVPLSLARMPRDARYGVFEMGMNHAGELSALTRIVRPHVAIVTAIAPAHIEFFDNIEGIADAKGEIFEGLEPDGTALIPFDSPHRDRLIGWAKPHAARIWTFGRGEGADIRACEVSPEIAGTIVSVVLPTGELTYTIGLPGDHWVSNSLAVIGAVEAVGGDLAAAGLALAEMAGLPGRGARLAIPVGDGEALLIDESYNANPVSMRAALNTLGEERAERRIAVLGAMGELGEDSDRYHAELARPLTDAGVELAVLVGEPMKVLADALGNGISIVHVPDAAAAQESLDGEIRSGDAVLVKGSNYIGLARLVEALAGGKTVCST
ncbi:UDP-N-acetylmuramoyl-tripeptide--D-alanyl-D-alanine ligase [Parasphingopyxis algicola]|uniref:UDP-N-acetylmuramoyl-tripeptide--D-alanyl-D- alanine ligase n=1 Tax=Parasphingopyxis algicola TaxID=2026624 RepID=UPI00159FC921|nr:UDP-N-acetylmuramoyl-tripeptide--D-alanyl-D-alanine ligase [Parasphingopyxis algicola]QLC26289.1 UDP-N-acetylmuramoyl-tripeptide--D-alanyl-D-alanine ligase [Parasphingopyxis algicola]